MQKQTIEVKQIDWFDDHFYKIRYVNEAKVEVEDYFPSTTTKLGAISKPQLLKWYANLGWVEAKRQAQEAADRGSRIHWAWYVYTTGGAVIYDPDIANPPYTREEISEIAKRFNNHIYFLKKQDEMYDFLKLQRMYAELKPVSVQSELIVYDIEHREAGTTDNIIEINEGEYTVAGSKPLKLEKGFYIGDLKTGNAVSKEHFMQCSDYMICAEKMGIVPEIKGILIYHTSALIKSGIEGLKVFFIPREEALSHYSDFRDIAKVWERNFGTKKPTIRQLPAMVTLLKESEWNLSGNSSEDEAKEPTENKSESGLDSPKEDVPKAETKSSNTTSKSSSKEQANSAPASKTPSKKA